MFNPQVIINNVMKNSDAMRNPVIKNAIDLYKQGNISGVNELASNLCKEKGTTMEEMTKKIMSQFGM